MIETNEHEASYILGHSEAETIRLQTQAKILRPITERLLRSAGIRPRMRVLDLGSGGGDVAMLAAQLVGPSGWVVGIDRNHRSYRSLWSGLTGSVLNICLFTKQRLKRSVMMLDLTLWSAATF